MTVDLPGTCHMVGCPGKGKHVPHSLSIKSIGAGTWEDYNQAPLYCIGFPIAVPSHSKITVRCSIDEVAWAKYVSNLTPTLMAEFVDVHRLECPNRRPR